LTTHQVLDQSAAVQQSPALINFIESLSNSQGTRKTYLYNLNKFMKFLRVKDLQELLLWDSKVIENNIVSFIVASRNAGMAPKSIRISFAAIRHFYKMNDVVLNWDKLKMFVGKSNAKKAIDRPYSHDEIHKMLEYSTPRERVLILLMAGAGLRGGIADLSVGDLQKISLPNTGQTIYEITVYRGFDEQYETLCSVETAAAIDSYLEYRKTRLHETITEESPLVVNLQNKEELGGHKNTAGTRMTVHNIQLIIWRLLNDVGMRRADNKKIVQGSRHSAAICHSMRKFFASQLEHADMKDLMIESLLGHKTGLRGVYRKINHDDLVRVYKMYGTSYNQRRRKT
jgi:site-specific recombinase XerC